MLIKNLSSEYVMLIAILFERQVFIWLQPIVYFVQQLQKLMKVIIYFVFELIKKLQKPWLVIEFLNSIFLLIIFLLIMLVMFENLHFFEISITNLI